MPNLLAPHKKKWLSNSVLAGFIVLVGATAFLSDALKTPVKSHNEFIEQALVFNNKELENITRIALKNKSGEYVFERTDATEGSIWRMTSPKAISTNSVFIEKFFASLNIIKTKKLLVDDKINNSNFSLDKPTAILTLTDSTQKNIILSVGIMNTIDNSTYMKISGKSGIYHVEAPSLSLENITLADLIESTIFDVALADITSFKIFKKGTPAAQFEVYKKEGKWVSINEAPLDTGRLEDMLDDFIVLKSSYLLDEQTDAQKKQIQKIISPPEYIVKIDTVDNKNLSYQVSADVKSLPDFSLNDEPHFLIIENHAPIVYIVKKEFETLFELKNEALKALEATAPR